MTVATDFVSNYEQHPHFHFSAGELKLDLEAAGEFNRIYGAVRNYQSSLSRKDKRAAYQQCGQLLDRIFRNLADQATDPQETRFLEELLRECRILLQTDFRQFESITGRNHAHLSDSRSAQGANELRERRYFIDTLSPDEVKTLQGLAADSLRTFRENAAKGNLTREALSVGSGSVIEGIAATLNEAYERLGVLAAVSAYAGKAMHVTGAALEMSVAKASWWASTFADLPRPPHTLYAHIDEGLGIPKSIVYLSDVDESRGPTSCYPGLIDDIRPSPLQRLVGRIVGNVGSAPDSPLRAYYNKTYYQSVGAENFRRHFMRLPREARFNSHFGWDVLPGSEFEGNMIAREVTMLGRAGTFLVFDGESLVHRGGLVKSGERVALQVLFGEPSWKRKLLAKIRRTLK